jgi:hypothetical protein
MPRSGRGRKSSVRKKKSPKKYSCSVPRRKNKSHSPHSIIDIESFKSKKSPVRSGKKYKRRYKKLV